MAWCTLLVTDLKLFNHILDGTVDKVSALVTHQNPWTSKYGDQFIKQEVCYCLYIAVFY
jgi:hypothetical protein